MEQQVFILDKLKVSLSPGFRYSETSVRLPFPSKGNLGRACLVLERLQVGQALALVGRAVEISRVVFRKPKLNVNHFA
jgi:hypothetical protein